MTPTSAAFESSTTSPASATACCVATTAYWEGTLIRRRSLLGTTSSGWKSRTSAQMSFSNGEASNLVSLPTPERPSSIADQTVATSFPRGQTTPRPVTTTRCSSGSSWNGG